MRRIFKFIQVEVKRHLWEPITSELCELLTRLFNTYVEDHYTTIPYAQYITVDNVDGQICVSTSNDFKVLCETFYPEDCLY